MKASLALGVILKKQESLRGHLAKAFIVCFCALLISGDVIALQGKPSFGQLHRAAKEGDLPRVIQLLDAGAFDPQRNQEFSILIVLLECRYETASRIEIVKHLIAAGADPNFEIASNNVFMLLARCPKNSDNLALTKLFLELGANPQLVNNVGQSVLQACIYWRNEEMALLLTPVSSISAKDLRLAMLYEMPKLVEELLAQNIDIQQNPVMKWAIKNGFNEVLEKILIMYGNPDNFIVKNETYGRPIIYAAYECNRDAIELLKRYGAASDVMSPSGRHISDILGDCE